jgi:hypothetical protein
MQQVTEGLNRSRLLLGSESLEVQRAGRDDSPGRSASKSNESALDLRHLVAKGLPSK